MTKGKKAKKAGGRTAGSGAAKAGRGPDARLVYAQLADPLPDAGPGAPAWPAGSYVSPVRTVILGDGREVMVMHPQAVSFYLIEAKRHRDRAERVRRNVLKTLRQRADGVWASTNTPAVLDCLSGLITAVLFSFTAIEAMANGAIDSLPDGAQVTVERQGSPTDVPKAEMVRRLSLTEKLHLVVPRLTGRPSVKGTQSWEAYVKLMRLRNELVHVKTDFAYAGDAQNPSAPWLLLRGDASACVEDVVALISALNPDWLTADTIKELGVA